MKNKMGYLNLLVLFFAAIMNGCVKEESKEFTDSPIIESYLQPGNYLSLKLTRQIPFSDDVEYSSDNIDKMDISVLYKNNTYILTPLDSGNYIDSSVVIAEGDSFTISFSFNEKDVSAYTYIPSKPSNMQQSTTEISIEKIDSSSFPTPGDMPDPITITWDNSDASYYILLVENIETTLEAIRDFGDEDPPTNIFRKSPTNLNTEDLSSFDFQYFGTHRIILYHVLPDYASLYDQNSTSSQNLTNPSTSIVNGYGIFTGLNSDTLYVEVKEQ